MALFSVEEARITSFSHVPVRVMWLVHMAQSRENCRSAAAKGIEDDPKIANVDANVGIVGEVALNVATYVDVCSVGKVAGFYTLDLS